MNSPARYVWLASLAVAMLMLLAAPAARAQLVYTLDAGGTTASWEDGPRSSGLALTPTLRLELPRSSVIASGGLSFFGRGEWTTQGLLSASTFSRAVHGVRAEWAGTARGVAYTGGQVSAYLHTQGRLHLASATRGVWTGGGVGRTVSRSSTSGLALADAGAWWRASSLTLSASFTRSWFRSRDVPLYYYAPASLTSPAFPPGSSSQLPADWFAYRSRVLDDAVATFHWERGPLDLDASVGARLRTSTDAARRWGAASATIWLTHTLGLVAAGGTSPESFLQGFSNVRYATLGLRVSSTPRARAELPPRPTRAEERTPPTASRLVVVHDAGTATRTIRLVTPGATRVELMADFTDWLPVPLERIAPDTWELPTRVAPGTYRVSVRVDDGEWGAPPGVPGRKDEFGGEGGVVVVQ